MSYAVNRKVVWKTSVPYPVDGDTEILVPVDAKILKFAEQQGSLGAWFLCDPEVREKNTVRLTIMMTGQETVKSNVASLTYIDTVLMRNGTFVVHIFQDES